MVRKGASDKLGELAMGWCSFLVGLRSICQFLDQLSLTFIELWRISWGDEFDVLGIEKADQAIH